MSELRPPAGPDPTVPSPARVYDYLLGGKDNYPVDRMVGDRMLTVAPDTRLVARANRGFLKRALTLLTTEAGITQFIDLGTGIPTSPSVHEIVREVQPSAKVVYVDNDPLVKVHNDALLATDPGVITLQADVRRPLEILEDPEVQALIDFDKPVGLLLIAVLHFVSDSEDPAGIIGTFRSRMVPGSHVVMSNTSAHSDPDAIAQIAAMTAGTPSQSTFRTRDQLKALLTGFELLSPGMVRIQDWRPDMEAPQTGLDVQAAVARLP